MQTSATQNMSAKESKEFRTLLVLKVSYRTRNTTSKRITRKA